MTDGPAFLFDLDGTLVDSVYQHVLAWRVALEDVGIDLSVWRIHRRIGMSGGLFINALLRETEAGVTDEQITRIRTLHASAYSELAGQVRPLPGARELLATLGNCHQRSLGDRRPGHRNPRHPRGRAHCDPRPSSSCEARSRPLHDGGRASWRQHLAFDRGGGQHLGSTGGAPGASTWGWAPRRRLWPRRAGDGRSVPRLRGPCRSPAPSRRGRSARCCVRCTRCLSDSVKS
jgi:hypothetical protein